MTKEHASLESRERARAHGNRLQALILIRWVAVFGIAAASLMTQAFRYSMLTAPPWLLVPFALGYNALFWWWLRYTRRVQWPLERIERSLRYQAYLQALCDMLAMLLLVYLDGGIEYTLYYAPLIALMLASLILPRSGLFIQANVGTILFIAMALAEYNGWIPHQPFLQEPYQYGLFRRLPAVLGTAFSLTGVLNLTAFLMSSLVQRLNQAEARTWRLLGQLQREVREASARLAGSAASLQEGAAEVSQVAEQIAATVHQIAQGAGQQATQLDRLSHSLEEMSAAGQRVAEGTLETHQASTQTVASADRGRDAAGEATLRMDEISSVFVQAEEVMDALSHHSEEIAEVAAAIDQFAERTDLLALNAEIEAARAGEHGLGFAVVAGEVKKLAAASSASAERVAAMVAQVRAEVASVVRSFQTGGGRVRDGQRAIATLHEVLDAMAAVIAHTDELAATMESLTLQQRQAHQEIVKAAGEIASAAEETAAGAEETAAAVEQQTASFGDFSRAAQNLADLAAQLDQAVAGLTGENNLPTPLPRQGRGGSRGG
jgi:methyl-accepting chemotaxis protein